MPWLHHQLPGQCGSSLPSTDQTVLATAMTATWPSTHYRPVEELVREQAELEPRPEQLPLAGLLSLQGRLLRRHRLPEAVILFAAD